MSGIYFERTPYERRRILITAKQEGREVGRVDYLPAPLSGARAVELGYLHVNPERRGERLATALLREFVADVGSDRKVSASIIHDETYDSLAILKPELMVDPSKLLITDKQILKTIPIVKIFESGGLDTYRLWVASHPLKELEGLEAYEFPELTVFPPLFRIIAKATTRGVG